jgi:hypothetical protein
MENSAQIRRLALESLAIVGSILLAFAIDAWWEDSREKQRRLVLLDDLKAETAVNIEELTSIIEKQELYSQEVRALVRAMLGAEQVSSAKLETLRRQTTGFPTFQPSWGILDLLTASGDLVLVEDSDLRTALANLKARVSNYLANQEIVIRSGVSDVALYESGTHLYPWVLPDKEDTVDNGTDAKQLEVAIKNLEFRIGMHEDALMEQGKQALEDFEEVLKLLP